MSRNIRSYGATAMHEGLYAGQARQISMHVDICYLEPAGQILRLHIYISLFVITTTTTTTVVRIAVSDKQFQIYAPPK